MLHRKVVAAALLLIGTLSGPLLAQEGLPLTVVLKDEAERITLYLDDLDAMEQVEFSTKTIWTDEKAHFSGVAVWRLLEELGAEGNTLRMSALNDYAVEMPVADLEENAPIIATRMNGEVMPVRQKGPYWVIYPFDSNPDYRTEANFSRSVWQLTKLSVLD